MDFLIWHLLRESARRIPENEALVHNSERFTYAQVARRTAGLAAALRAAGMRRLDRIGIYLDASVAQVLSIFGISQGEGVYVPINALLHAEQVMHIASDCGMKGLITTPAKLSELAAILPRIPSLEFLVVAGDGDTPKTQLPVYRFDSLCATDPPAVWKESSIEKNLAAILYTSGSTGKPKGVMLNHANVLPRSPIVSDYLQITEHERILALLPFSFP